jgi:hypothetical protein
MDKYNTVQYNTQFAECTSTDCKYNCEVLCESVLGKYFVECSTEVLRARVLVKYFVRVF